MRLSDFDVLSFDCYGTLIDWESGMVAALGPWLEARGDRRTATRSSRRSPRRSASAAADARQAVRELLADVHGSSPSACGVPQDPAAARRVRRRGQGLAGVRGFRRRRSPTSSSTTGW